MDFSVRRAREADLDEIAALFDAYRRLYSQTEDLPAARAFIAQRLTQDDSILFVAEAENGGLIGFAQLFPTFSSVLMRRTYVLNDLFVDPSGRRGGVGQGLLEAAREFAQSTGAARLSLKTAVDNRTAQRLYEASGYLRDEAFFGYDLSI